MAALGEVDNPKQVSRDPSDDPVEHGRLPARIAYLLALRDRLPAPLTKCQRVEDCAAKFNSSVVPLIGDYTNKGPTIILFALSHYAAFRDELPKLLSTYPMKQFYIHNRPFTFSGDSRTRYFCGCS